MPAALDPGCIFRALADAEVDYVLIGGLAAVLHGSPAMTNDADIVPAAAEENLERLAAVLRGLDARLRTPQDPEGVPFDPHPALLASVSILNLTTRCGDLDLALHPAALDDYGELVARSVTYDLDGIRVRVAALADLIRSKTAADRPKDRLALPLLRALEEERRELR